MALSLATVLDRSLKEGIRRRQCEHATVYTHEELCAWIGVALPSWTVHGPSILGDNALAASWPCDDHVNNVEKWLSDNGCKDPANLLAGACEPLALFLSREAEKLLLAGVEPAGQIPDLAHKEALTTLAHDVDAPQSVFGGGFTGGFVHGHATWTMDVWGSKYGDRPLASYMYGGEGVQARIMEYAAELGRGDQHVGTMPLYVINYIWDGDELSTKDMLNTADETAMYSIHVVGLVLDAKNKTVVIADPNGGLLPGGNMELLAVPPRMRNTGPSTALSQFDIDELAAKEEEEKKKGKKIKGKIKKNNKRKHKRPS